MRFLTENDVDRLLSMPDVIGVMETAFQNLASGQAENAPRVRVRAPGVVLHSMSAAAAYAGVVGWKQYTTTRQGAKFHVGLYDEAGRWIALIEADHLGQLRTGAVTGLAARSLAGREMTKVGLIGCGWQAESQLEAVAASLPLQQALVYCRSPERRNEFAGRLSRRLNLDVRACDEPRQAVEGSPLVVTATTSRTPVFDDAWLAPGAIVCAIGSNWLEKAEVGVETVRRASAVVCDSVECCRREAGELALAAKEGAFDWNQAVELADVVAGNRDVSSVEGTQPVLFKSVGMALEDVALAKELLDMATEQNVGREIPLA